MTSVLQIIMYYPTIKTLK